MHINIHNINTSMGMVNTSWERLLLLGEREENRKDT